MTTRVVEISADPIDAFEATVEVLEHAITEGAFREILSEAPRHYAIEWRTTLAGARYDFRFERASGSMTRTEAQLEFSGVLSPLLTLFRGAGNGPHLMQILNDVRDLAESDEFYEDDDEEDEQLDDDEEEDRA